MRYFISYVYKKETTTGYILHGGDNAEQRTYNIETCYENCVRDFPQIISEYSLREVEDSLEKQHNDVVSRTLKILFIKQI